LCEEADRCDDGHKVWSVAAAIAGYNVKLCGILGRQASFR